MTNDYWGAGLMRNVFGEIEAVLFVSGEAVPVDDLAQALDLTPLELEMHIEEMRRVYEDEKRGILPVRVGSKIQLRTNEIYSGQIVTLLRPTKTQTLTQPSLETLSVIAYRQPVTRAEIEAVRGVKCDYSISMLIEKRLVCELGRKETLGHPILYGTTDEFLRHFGLESIKDLPPVSDFAPVEDGDEMAI